ncbi:hypothetical protein [Amycolatopsis jejuensis]|uniref:hypothetical protein n=1 Tax=Amycolatopsis jejuensis TaxID=330084 RepID=UPI00138DF2BC|nr:hypothetical protein [Amycolatopsis jejuensis]
MRSLRPSTTNDSASPTDVPFRITTLDGVFGKFSVRPQFSTLTEVPPVAGTAASGAVLQPVSAVATTATTATGIRYFVIYYSHPAQKIIFRNDAFLRQAAGLPACDRFLPCRRRLRPPGPDSPTASPCWR